TRSTATSSFRARVPSTSRSCTARSSTPPAATACGETTSAACTVGGDPLFVDARATTTLQPGSPAVDARGSLALDLTHGLDGTPRPQGSAPDLGAYELCQGDCIANPSPESGSGSASDDPTKMFGRGGCNAAGGVGCGFAAIIGLALLGRRRRRSRAIEVPT